jgi:hypothetical protein
LPIAAQRRHPGSRKTRGSSPGQGRMSCPPGLPLSLHASRFDAGCPRLPDGKPSATIRRQRCGAGAAPIELSRRVAEWSSENRHR